MLTEKYLGKDVLDLSATHKRKESSIEEDERLRSLLGKKKLELEMQAKQRQEEKENLMEKQWIPPRINFPPRKDGQPDRRKLSSTITLHVTS